MNTCAHCRTPIPGDSRFCPSCGRPVAQMSPQMNAGYPTDRAERKKGSGLLVWIPFLLLLLIGALFFWAGGVSIVGWTILAICFVAVFAARAWVVRSGMIVGAIAWVVLLIVLVGTLGATSSSRGSAVAGGASTSQGPTATSAPKTAQYQNTPQPASAQSARPTATTLKGAPPDVLKPLVAALGRQPTQVDYSLNQNGDSSYAFMVVQMRGPTQQLSNWAGDTTWTGTFSFFTSEARAKSNFQSQLKTTREDSGFSDNLGIFSPRVENPLGKADEGYSFTRSWKDQPQASMRTYVARQGATYFYVDAQGDSKSPLVAGDGIDSLLAEMKNLDNSSIEKWVPGAGASPAQPTAAPKPASTSTPLPTALPQPSSSGMKVQNAVAGTSIDDTQKIANPTSVFRPDTEEICFSAEVRDVSQPTAVDIQLVYLATGDSIKGPIQRLEPAQGVSRVGFVFSAPTRGWPQGQYRATFYLNGQDAGSVNFSVQ